MPLSVFRKDGGVTKNEQLMGEKHLVTWLWFYSRPVFIHPSTCSFPWQCLRTMVGTIWKKNQFKNSKLLIQKDMKKRTNDTCNVIQTTIKKKCHLPDNSRVTSQSDRWNVTTVPGDVLQMCFSSRDGADVIKEDLFTDRKDSFTRWCWPGF